jgi:Na+/melibiose symporter-like transporter
VYFAVSSFAPLPVSVAREAIKPYLHDYLGVAWFIAFLNFGLSLLVSAVFCFSKMLLKIIKTSAKLAKMKREDKKHLVHAFRRRLFSYISGAALLGFLAVVSALNSIILF